MILSKYYFSFSVFIFFVFFSMLSVAQTAQLPLSDYKDLTQLIYKATFSTNNRNESVLTIALENDAYKNQRLALDLKKLWKSNVAKRCKGKFKGRPSFYENGVSSTPRCYDFESKQHYSCPDIVSGISGAFTCKVGV